MTPAAAGVAFAILGIVVVLFALPPLFERMAGWAQLAERFAPAPAGARTRLGYATLGVLATAPVRLDATAEGLVLSLAFTPFRATPPLLIPWPGISGASAGGRLLVDSFTFPPASRPRLFVKPHVAQRLRHRLTPRGTG